MREIDSKVAAKLNDYQAGGGFMPGTDLMPFSEEIVNLVRSEYIDALISAAEQSYDNYYILGFLRACKESKRGVTIL